MSHGVRRLDLFVTEACNLGCDYCFAATNPRRNPNQDDTRKRIDWLMDSESARVHITLWGGEPLLRKGLLQDIVRHAREQAASRAKTVSFSMPTNASLIDGDTMRWLEDNHVQTFLSIDGNERGQRGRPLKSGRSSHELVSIGMRRALDAKVESPPAIRMTVSPTNAADQADGVRYFLDHGARELLIYAAMDQPWSSEALADFTRGQRAVAELFIELIEDSEDPTQVANFKAWRPILRRLSKGVPARSRRGAMRTCGVGKELIGVTVEGKFTPCHRIVFYGRNREQDVDLGTIETGLDEAAAAAWSQLRIEDMRGVSQCVECPEFDLCTFGCVAVSYSTTGRRDRVPEAACALIAAQNQVCREIHARLADHPHYRLYLGQSLDSTVDRVANELGSQAWKLFQSAGARA